MRIQTSSESHPSLPSWFGEVVLVAAHLRKCDVLPQITKRVRFARRRFGRYEVIDFLAVLFGYAFSGERTLEAFYEGIPACLPVRRAPAWPDGFPNRMPYFFSVLEQRLGLKEVR